MEGLFLIGWIALIIVLALPMGYGWGFLGWGPPLPRYVQRRRSARAAAAAVTKPFDHEAWGPGGDWLWAGFIILVLGAGLFLATRCYQFSCPGGITGFIYDLAGRIYQSG